MGETLDVFFYRLGRTDPPVRTGHPSPERALVTNPLPNAPRATLAIVPNFLNALSSAPRTAFSPEVNNAIPLPLTAALLVADQIGVYKVSFTCLRCRIGSFRAAAVT